MHNHRWLNLIQVCPRYTFNDFNIALQKQYLFQVSTMLFLIFSKCAENRFSEKEGWNSTNKSGRSFFAPANEPNVGRTLTRSLLRCRCGAGNIARNCDRSFSLPTIIRNQHRDTVSQK